MCSEKSFTYPFVKFSKLYERRRKLFLQNNQDNFNACFIATAKDNTPTLRTVLLKEFDSNGFIFYTNLHSKKGSDIKNNPQVALLFYWPEFKVQVRVSGKASLVSDNTADSYFSTRSYKSKIGAWASKQSQVMTSIFEFYQKIAQYSVKYKTQVPRPSHWSGFIIEPEYFEFWQEKPFRLHIRKVYIKSKNGWQEKLLYP